MSSPFHQPVDSPTNTMNALAPHPIGELIAEVEQMSVGAPREDGIGNAVHYDHQRAVVEQLVSQIRYLKRSSPMTMSPGLYRDIGLAEVVKEFAEYLNFIKNQDLHGDAKHAWYNTCAKKKNKKRNRGPPVEVPDFKVVHVNTTKCVSQMLHAIYAVNSQGATVPLLAVDIEGFDHVNKVISIVEMSVPLLEKVYIIDTLVL